MSAHTHNPLFLRPRSDRPQGLGRARAFFCLLALAATTGCGGGGGGSKEPSVLAFVTTALPAGKVDERYRQDVVAAGGEEPFTFSLAGGELPPGLDLSEAFGRISGTPTTPGSFAFSVGVSSVDGQSATGQFTITVAEADMPPGPLVITTESLPDGAVGTSYREELEIEEGMPPLTWTVDGALPDGLTLDGDDGLIRGVPAVGGDFEFTIVVIDGERRQGSKTLSITIEPAPDLVILTQSIPDGNRGEPYEAIFEAEGGVPPYTWRVKSGDLPTGLIIVSDGAFRGTPENTGSFDIVMEVEDTAPIPATAEVMLDFTIRPPVQRLAVRTEFIEEAFIEVPYSATLEAVGGIPPYSWELLIGDLPDGLSFNPTTANISGTPSAQSEGVYPLRFQVEDAGDATHPVQTAIAEYSLAVFGEAGRPRLVEATAIDASRGGRGIQEGDILRLRFDRSTNAPEIAAVDAEDFITIEERSLAGFTASWVSTNTRDDTLLIEFDLSGGEPSVVPGDLVRFPVGGIRDRSDTLGAVGSPPRIQGSFSYEVPLENTFGVRLRLLPASGSGDTHDLGAGDSPTTLAAGDFTGDGLPDLAIVAPRTPHLDEAPGSVYIVAGDGGLPLGDLNLSNPDNFRARLDGSIEAVAAGDLDGDGDDELVLGAPSRGEVYIIAGGTSFPDGVAAAAEVGDAGAVITGSAAARFGHALTVLSVTEDAREDLLVSAPLADVQDRTGAGALYVFAGGVALVAQDRSVTEDVGSFTVRLDGPTDFAGVSGELDAAGVATGLVATTGFVTGAATPDLILGYSKGQPDAAGETPERRGEVIVLQGGLGDTRGVVDLADPTEVHARIRLQAAGAALGHAVLTTDLTGDRQDDLVIAAPGHGVQGRAEAGVVYVVAGGARFPSGTGDIDVDGLYEARIIGASRLDAAGRAVAAADLNRDSWPDLVVGAPQAGESVGSLAQGHTYVVYGSAEGLLGDRNMALREDQDLRFTGDNTRDVGGEGQRVELGAALLTADVDGDQVPDLIAAAPAPTSSGAVYVLGVHRDEAPVLVEARAEATHILQLRFNRPTNQLEITQENLGEVLKVAGRSPGGLVEAAWSTTLVSNDTLRITLDGTQTLEPGDRLGIGAGTIRDELGRLEAIGGAIILGAFE